MCNLQETPGPGDPGSGAPLLLWLAAAALLRALRPRAVGRGARVRVAARAAAVHLDQPLLLHFAEKVDLGCDGHATGPQVR